MVLVAGALIGLNAAPVADDPTAVETRERREAEPLSVLDILTMDATVLVGALLDLNLDHYGRK